MNVFVKLLGDGQSTATIIFARFSIGLLVLLPWFLSDKTLFQVSNKSKILFRCITTILVIACVFYALKYMPVADVLLLNMSFPLFLPLLVWIMLRVQTPMKMMAGMVVGFVGVVLILHPGIDTFNWHGLIALFSGILAALAMLQIRLLTKTTSTKQILFYLFVFGTISTGLMVPFSFEMPTYYQLFLLFLVGIMGSVYQVFVTLALKYAKARVVSPIYFSCILFSVVCDWLIWAVKPDLMALIGMGLVIVGGIVTILMSKEPALEKAPAHVG
jgi:drug/metabolite transporter (DMT)-like permease